jgi:hypothetical protein
VIVVSNSSPLIAGADMGMEAIFEALFGEIIIPPAVRQEVFTSRPQPSWITERPLTNPKASELLQGLSFPKMPSQKRDLILQTAQRTMTRSSGRAPERRGYLWQKARSRLPPSV